MSDAALYHVIRWSVLFFTFPDLRTRRWLRLHARVVVLRVLQDLCIMKSRRYSQYGGRL
jgi:hypothetical protein